jgi:hypothetical protein
MMKVNIHADSRITAIIGRNVCECLYIEGRTDENIFENSGAVVRFRPPIFAGCNRIARSWYRSSYG